jgi:mitochondrial import receptor subunit TOM22
MLPPGARTRIASTASAASSYARSGGLLLGRTLWVVSTSVLLLGVPWALAYAEEQQLVEMEREMKMQQSANDVSLFLSLLSSPEWVGVDEGG